MNRELLLRYIDDYKLNFDYVNSQELYKWKAVKCFKDNWDINAQNFSEMLIQSIRLTKNLLNAGQYFPLRMLEQYAIARPDEIRSLFINLFNEEEGLFERMEHFQIGINQINDELFTGKKSYQDRRAVIVYLTLRYPERYYFYKYEMFKVFSTKLSTFFSPVKGRIENVSQFNNLCDLINYELSQDQELLKLHKNRIDDDCYFDENLKILTQDFIYAVAKHLNDINPINNPVAFFQPQESFAFTNEISVETNPINFNGRIVNFLQNNAENKRIGDLGELWVMDYEQKKLKRLNKHRLVREIKHIAKDKGDGTGYDILSFDENEQRIFIEVKTTRNDKNSTFYITRNELERSKIEKNNYYLYRLYDYNDQTNTANVNILQGDLSGLCEFPAIYTVNIKD